jgi:transposase-like protein
MQVLSKATRPTFWREALVRQRASGLSIQRFCAQEGLAAATFFVWKRRLGREDGGVGRAAAVSFAPLRVVAEGAEPTAPHYLEILLPRERRIRITGTVDRRQLADVLAALEEDGGSRPC